jgi:arginyl-tRNA synthetase
MDFRTYLTKSLHEAVLAAYPDWASSIESITLEKPKNNTYGDFATTVALSLAKSMRMPPRDVAVAIMSKFVWDEEFVVPDPKLSTTITGGFINFRMSTSYLAQILNQVVRDPSNFGRNQVAFPKRLLFEFVSANPTGPMVVVNGRAAAIGDVMARGKRMDRS